MLEWSVVGDGGRRDAVSSLDVYGGGQSGDISDGDDSEIAVMSPSLWCPLLRLCQPASRHPISPPPSWEQADTSQWRQRGSRTPGHLFSPRRFGNQESKRQLFACRKGMMIVTVSSQITPCLLTLSINMFFIVNEKENIFLTNIFHESIWRRQYLSVKNWIYMFLHYENFL